METLKRTMAKRQQVGVRATREEVSSNRESVEASKAI